MKYFLKKYNILLMERIKIIIPPEYDAKTNDYKNVELKKNESQKLKIFFDDNLTHKITKSPLRKPHIKSPKSIRKFGKHQNLTMGKRLAFEH